ncbi:hypothetical protein GR170_08160 [Pseudooceanicola sp. GBMRC 2024]|uniref:MFS transporter n=1 Tax=Pseudooceanicola albus TaxID=2692189 RepID=A0A6L7G0E2_9RHOB|nr:MFS transporter [Pseudooceanicola albus]MXN17804.1 hypothetical protein [Pseudooceanicola albus]
MTMVSEQARDVSAQALIRLAGIMLVGVSGSSGFLVVPLVVAALRKTGTVPELWIGTIGSSDLAGMFAGAALSLLPVVRLAPRRAVAAALMISLVANACALASPPLVLLFLFRFLSGLGGGIALAMALTALGRTRHPDRSFAVISILQMSFGMLASYLANAGLSGLGSIYQTMFVTLALALCMAWTFPATLEDMRHPNQTTGPRKLNRRLIATIIVANMCSACGFLVLWANIEALARRAGIDPSHFVLLMDIGLIGGLAGTLLTIVIDGRPRRTLFACLYFGAGLLGALLFEVPLGPIMVFVAAFLFQLAPAAVCYGFGAISESDPSGRLPIVHILSVKFGFTIAPIFGSVLVQHVGIGAVAPASFLITLAAMLGYCLQIREAERDIRSLQHVPAPAR